MTNSFHPGAGVLFMKVGTHANESLEDIIARKTKEIEDAGYALWGYGGGTCHPQSMVQPFAKAFEEKGQTIRLCMKEMDSKHFAEQLRAEKMSADGINWENIPSTVNCMGSRYGLVIRNLRPAELVLPLSQTQVAVGPSQGRKGIDYIKGRVDKACFEVLERPKVLGEKDIKAIKISLIADIVKPFAVFLK